MADFDDLVKQARALGDAVAAHPRVRKFADAQRRVSQDDEAKRLLNDYQTAAQRVHELEVQQQPIAPEDKRRLSECERSMASNDALKTLMRAQADYLELMESVNRSMEDGIHAGLSAKP